MYFKLKSNTGGHAEPGKDGKIVYYKDGMGVLLNRIVI